MFSHIFVAGTFDGLHKGHEAVLSRAFSEGKEVTIGLTSDQFVSKFKKNLPVRPFFTRKGEVEAWIARNGVTVPFDILSIDDPHEPLASLATWDSVIITSHNKKTAEEINAKRASRGLPLLQMVNVPLVPAEDGAAISSTRVRNGDIDTAGRLILPQELRHELKKPIGTVTTIQNIKDAYKDRSFLLVTVGDVTTDLAFSHGLNPDLAIVDLHVKRRPYKPIEQYPFAKRTVITVSSGPGNISTEAIDAVKGWCVSLHPKFVIHIQGEDDLLVLPVVEYAPTGTRVLYGQPDEGVVEVVVSEASKKTVKDILRRFEKG